MADLQETDCKTNDKCERNCIRIVQKPLKNKGFLHCLKKR